MIHTIQCECGLRVEVFVGTNWIGCPSCGRPLREQLLRAMAGRQPDHPARGLYYRHSGRFPVTGLLAGVLAGAGVGLGPAAGYAYCTFHSPFIYVNPLLTFGFGLFLGWASAWVLKAGRVRSLAAALGGASLATAIAFYFSWAVWAHIVLTDMGAARAGPLNLALSPGLLWEGIVRINEVGAWTLGSFGERASGPGLWLLWACEASVLFTASVLAVLWMMRSPFCETCRSWCRKVKPRLRIAVRHLPNIQARFEAKDPRYPGSLEPADEHARDWLDLTLRCCPGCGHTNTLAIRLVRLDVVGRDRTVQRTRKVLDRLLLDKEEIETVRQVGRATGP